MALDVCLRDAFS
ncbi:hypothetical protein GU254_10100 [Vibrio cholerae]|nr:hypothetical protein [Vibrio cholerae]MBN7279103.1 hypothetical protein [Vibrio paracholerae]EGR4140634.1 hypothetical protein [Vibrio cholerae]EKF9147213.1 hypothetical protein [Vibrio cholerae]EKF9778787.1 hypothetical protein [Vibrio cholerae]